jgi:para-aminobenzoate synthetase component 1
VIFQYANRLGEAGTPFLIVVNYDKSDVVVIPLDELEKHDIEFTIGEKSRESRKIESKIYPVSFSEYREKFIKVIDSIKRGYTYVLNLTQETEVKLDSTLKEVYRYSDAKYRIRFKDQFVSYSPETFIKIENSQIRAFPMKGTLDAAIPNGEHILLSDQKEFAEHVMIVDLLRNDLNMVSKSVRVENFRNISKINSGERELLQMSSEVVGELESGWQSRIGDILENILPAGSITGTPKKRTLDLISEIEGYNRGFFTGVFGVFRDGKFDSGVMIRFLEKRGDRFIYKSGGGITLDSSVESEYREMIDKVYLF